MSTYNVGIRIAEGKLVALLIPAYFKAVTYKIGKGVAEGKLVAHLIPT
jgi:hypothetical protein